MSLLLLLWADSGSDLQLCATSLGRNELGGTDSALLLLLALISGGFDGTESGGTKTGAGPEATAMKPLLLLLLLADSSTQTGGSGG